MEEVEDGFAMKQWMVFDHAVSLHFAANVAAATGNHPRAEELRERLTKLEQDHPWLKKATQQAVQRLLDGQLEDLAPNTLRQDQAILNTVANDDGYCNKCDLRHEYCECLDSQS